MHYAVQAGLEFQVFLLPQLPKYWDYRYVPPHPTTVAILTSGLGKNSPTKGMGGTAASQM